MNDPFRPLKNAFGRFATGVTLAGCQRPDGSPLMITVNSFTSVSLIPPIVSLCIGLGSRALLSILFQQLRVLKFIGKE